MQVNYKNSKKKKIVVKIPTEILKILILVILKLKFFLCYYNNNKKKFNFNVFKKIKKINDVTKTDGTRFKLQKCVYFFCYHRRPRRRSKQRTRREKREGDSDRQQPSPSPITPQKNPFLQKKKTKNLEEML